VFCCFNKPAKITAPVFDVWMRLLSAIEGSVLWLLQDNALSERNLRSEAAARGIDPRRLVFAEKLGLGAHLARQRLADLFLDTLPYNAHTTASDALQAGLPGVTCLGSTFSGRVAASLLNAAGLPELITHSLGEYEALALKLARDGDYRADVAARLLRNRGVLPLFDTDRFRHHIEAAYRAMWERWQRGESPGSLSIQPAADRPVRMAADGAPGSRGI
jgi:predicted O-linked N-acetylglucosamine transferase (SPINDLY family)